MDKDRHTLPSPVQDFLNLLNHEIKTLLSDAYLGCYLHGSLALGGFNPQKSDIDLLILIKKPLRLEQKIALVKRLLQYSNEPFPIELSILTIEQLNERKHPYPFDFHYSEFWRTRYTNEPEKWLSESRQTDHDLTAHLTILYHAGLCFDGPPIKTLFHPIAKKDYLSAILADYYDCLTHFEEEPVYSALNSFRVLAYLTESSILSKYDAGLWAIRTFPTTFQPLIRRLLDGYSSADVFELTAHEKPMLENLKQHIIKKMPTKQTNWSD
ncbi:aminoglycoside adenylyltransferase domain-containing protein [Enterococcus sp.]|uniref:aminoglycoside adenylyltransferase domain-containing protein n=1 Tax=Enterococcus sp. TaxID=35783 RepID=UPI002FC7CF16